MDSREHDGEHVRGSPEAARPDAGAGGQPSADLEFDALLARMRTGDREAAAEFVTRYGARVRRRIRGKLSQPMRRVFDSQELMATLARRLDAYVRAGRLAVASGGQFWALVFRIAEHAVVDKTRIFRRLQTTEAEDGAFAQGLLERLRRAEERGQDGAELELEKAFRMLRDATDRTILSLWLADTPHTVTAECVGLSPAAVRQRWQVIRKELRSRLAPEMA